ncbi:MAG: CDP-diacylglycerol diphosphatase [Arsenophonus sp.]
MLIYLTYIKINNDKLWKNINQKCISKFINSKLELPCIKINKQYRYVIYKDIKGILHHLFIPLDKISGIESPFLQRKNTENYFILAWKNRELFIKLLNKPFNEKFLSLAINSKYGRTQEQLHIHLACLKHQVFLKIKKNEDIITNNWKPLNEKINNHQYLAIKVSWLDINKTSPFIYLKKYVKKHNDDIAYYGLAMIPSNQKNEFILLAIRSKFLHFNFGSAGEIQDYQCKLMNN